MKMNLSIAKAYMISTEEAIETFKNMILELYFQDVMHRMDEMIKNSKELRVQHE